MEKETERETLIFSLSLFLVFVAPLHCHCSDWNKRITHCINTSSHKVITCICGLGKWIGTKNNFPNYFCYQVRNNSGNMVTVFEFRNTSSCLNIHCSSGFLHFVFVLLLITFALKVHSKNKFQYVSLKCIIKLIRKFKSLQNITLLHKKKLCILNKFSLIFLHLSEIRYN